MKPVITYVNTDAGIRNGNAAYSYWIQHDSNNVKHSARMAYTPKDSNEAEIASIIYALDRVAQDFADTESIVVRCDSERAIYVMKTNQIYGYHKYGGLYKQIRSQLKCPTIQYVHVKAHKKCESAAEWINSWCDKELRKHY